MTTTRPLFTNPPAVTEVLNLPWLVSLDTAARLWSVTIPQALTAAQTGHLPFRVIMINDQPMVTRASLLAGIPDAPGVYPCPRCDESVPVGELIEHVERHVAHLATPSLKRRR